MVVLTEEFHGLSLKRKGADEPELFAAGAADGDRAGFPLSCRATKMRRLACPDNGWTSRLDEPAVGAGAVAATAAAQDDVPMGDDAAAEAPYHVSGAAGGGDEKALVVYHGDAPRSAPPRIAFRAHADWVHAMLREADSRTVRELLLAGARGQDSDDLALAVVPWVAPSSAAEETEPASTAEEDAAADDGDGSEGVAAMDVEGDEEEQGRAWIGQNYAAAAEAFVYRWPQHCMAPPQMPAVAQASPVMWSW